MSLQSIVLRRTLLIPAFILLLLGSTAAQNRIVIHADTPADTISRHIYGNFSEHLGRCIYGGFYVGEGNTKIPNVRGIRRDVVEALRKIRLPNLRWPGGCFADTYHWKDGVGPKSQRPTLVNTWWGGVTEDNSFGTHEFLDLCEQIGAEPYFTGNVGSGEVQELAQWVQYVDFDGVSPMSKLRAENGHPKPWKVRYWGLGNEAWGCGGNMTPEYYADRYRLYATFVASSGNTPLFRIASGAGSGDYHWTEVLMERIPHHLLQGLALHHYAVIDWQKKSSATQFTEAEYFKTMQQTILIDELIRKHTAIMDKTDPGKKVALIVDEWGGWYDVEPGTNGAFLYQQNTMRDAMIAGVTLNIFNDHADRVKMANLAQTVNVLQAVILTDQAHPERMLLTPTYLVMEMYTVHHDAVRLPLELTAARYRLGNDSVQAVWASASRDARGLVHVSLVNIDARNAQPVVLQLQGAAPGPVRGRILHASRVQEHNTFDAPDRVRPEAFTGARADGQTVTLQMSPCSVVVLEIQPSHGVK
ncbi:MAG TPA: alpha-L-arabinofuranosidase C-terminal domain-containing protein [Chloroflexota bacterium]